MSAVATSRGAPDAMLVGADWVPARDGRTFEVANPATGDVLAYMPEASTAEVEAAVAAAAAAFPAWSGMDAAERGRIMCRFADLLAQHGVFARAEALDVFDRTTFGHHVYELPGGEVQVYLRDPGGNLVEVDWPSVATVGAAVRAQIQPLSEGRPQAPENMQARLFLAPPARESAGQP